MTASILESKLITAEEFRRLVDDGRLTELVRGRVIEMNRPSTSHGYYLLQIGFLFKQFVQQHKLGRVVGGEAGIVIQRDPDTVRGPDVAYYSYQRLPQGPLPEGYWPVSPELVVEVRSQDDRWKDILQKVSEYLSADVLIVLVVDPAPRCVHVFSSDNAVVALNADDRLTIPDVLPGFEIPVSQLFE